MNSKTDFRPFSKMFNIQFIQYIEIASDYINLRSTSHSDFNQAIKEISSQKWSPPILDLNRLGYIYVNGMYIYIYMYICIYSLNNFNLILYATIIIIYILVFSFDSEIPYLLLIQFKYSLHFASKTFSHFIDTSTLHAHLSDTCLIFLEI